MLADLVMRPVQLNDAAALAEIYNYYIKNTTITFEVTEVTADEMRQRIVEITAHHPYWVLEHKGKVIAYCYVHPWRTRAAFCIQRSCRYILIMTIVIKALVQILWVESLSYVVCYATMC